MPGRIYRRPRVTLDLIESGEFLARDDVSVALRFLDAVEGTLDQLARSPHLGRVRPLRRRSIPALRSIAVIGFPNWLVFYRQLHDGVEIIRVLHGARDLDRVLEDER